MRVFFQDGHEQISTDGGPDLNAYGVVGGTDKRADSQVLFDPAKEQFDLPTRLVDLCNLESRQREVVGEENERVLVVGRGVTNPTQQVGIILARTNPAQVDRLIAAQTGGAIHGTAGANARLQVRLCTDDEKCPRLSETSQSSEVQITAIHYVDRAWLDRNLVEQVDLVHRTLCQSEKSRNRTPQIQERMQFDRGIGRTKMGPRKKTQTPLDDGCLESVNGLL